MLQFLKPVVIKNIFLFLLIFFSIALIPLWLIIWYKKSRRVSPAIKLLTRCIKYGQTLRSEECHEVNDYLKKLKRSLEGFARGTSVAAEDNMLLAQAIEVLPLLYEISKPNTCCENVCDGFVFDKGLDCKASLRKLFDELKQFSQLPIISEKLVEIARVRKDVKAVKRYRKFLLLGFVLIYTSAALRLSLAILADYSWVVGLIVYVSCLVGFFFKYNYYCLSDVKAYKKSLKRTLCKT